MTKTPTVRFIETPYKGRKRPGKEKNTLERSKIFGTRLKIPRRKNKSYRTTTVTYRLSWVCTRACTFGRARRPVCSRPGRWWWVIWNNSTASPCSSTRARRMWTRRRAAAGTGISACRVWCRSAAAGWWTAGTGVRGGCWGSAGTWWWVSSAGRPARSAAPASAVCRTERTACKTTCPLATEESRGRNLRTIKSRWKKRTANQGG